jgi:hypothetical protein
VVHCLSVTLHRPLSRNHTYLRMFFYRNYSSAPISSILIKFWFLRTCGADDGGDNLDLVSEREVFEDTKGIIKISISKNRQHNGQPKKCKRTKNDLPNIELN